MRSQIFAAVFLAFFLGTQNIFMLNFHGRIGTALKPGCHKYIGKVECGNHLNGRRILPSAKVTVMEYDDLSPDDKISTAKINRDGTYRIVGCADDGFIDHSEVELYLIFEDVCFRDQRYLAELPQPNVFESYQLNDEKMSNDNNNSTDGAAENDHHVVSNPSKPHFRRKYPPQPRPRHRRQNPRNGAGVVRNPDVLSTYVKSGCFKFIGKVECENGYPILPSAKVTVLEYDNIGREDKVPRARINRDGTYLFIGCPEDRFLQHYYIQFEDVCFYGQRYVAPRRPLADAFEYYRLKSEW